MDLSQKRWRYLTRRLLFPSPLCPQHLTGGDGGAVYIRSWCIVAGAPGNFSMKGSLAELVARQETIWRFVPNGMNKK